MGRKVFIPRWYPCACDKTPPCVNKTDVKGMPCPECFLYCRGPKVAGSHEANAKTEKFK